MFDELCIAFQNTKINLPLLFIHLNTVYKCTQYFMGGQVKIDSCAFQSKPFPFFKCVSNVCVTGWSAATQANRCWFGSCRWSFLEIKVHLGYHCAFLLNPCLVLMWTCSLIFVLSFRFSFITPTLWPKFICKCAYTSRQDDGCWLKSLFGAWIQVFHQDTHNPQVLKPQEMTLKHRGKKKKTHWSQVDIFTNNQRLSKFCQTHQCSERVIMRFRWNTDSHATHH